MNNALVHILLYNKIPYWTMYGIFIFMADLDKRL